MANPDIHYTKMHGVGNSFVILENLHGELQGEDLSVLALRACHELEVDGMIVLCEDSDADVGMLFFNEDGSMGEMCGNGARCVARYSVEHGLVRDGENILIRATAGPVKGRRITRELYEVRLNDPSVIDIHALARIDGETVSCAYVELGSPGIPHAVVEVAPSAFDKLDELRERGRALRHSSSFPKGANVSFVSVGDGAAVRAITFERGVEDFTQACGTGCGAIALSLILGGKIVGEQVAIDMPGGRLSVRLRLDNGNVRDILLTGPTAVTAEGELS